MYTTYTIIVCDTMGELITAVNAALATSQPLGRPFINRQLQWCQAMVS